MYKRVDINENEEIDGYSYSNRDGLIETVDLSNGSVVELRADGNPLHEIYMEDIPKLILALQAAYDQLL